MEEDDNARDEANTNSAFSGTEKDTCDESCDTNGQPIAGILFWYVTAQSGKYMSQISYSRIRPTFVRFDTSICTSTKLFWTSQIIQDDYYVNHLHKFAGVILKAGHIS